MQEVKAGDIIEDFVCPTDGWIWFDEVGLLGCHEVYPTKEDAEKVLNEYVKTL